MEDWNTKKKSQKIPLKKLMIVSLSRLGAVLKKQFDVQNGVFRTMMPHMHDDLPGGIGIVLPVL
jgi:hypothetical protein